MNAITKARIRAIVKMRNDMSSAKSYDDVIRATPTCEHRSEEEYNRLIKICRECCPDGHCKMCGCQYSHKLALKYFDCQMGKFNG